MQCKKGSTTRDEEKKKELKTKQKNRKKTSFALVNYNFTGHNVPTITFNMHKPWNNGIKSKNDNITSNTMAGTHFHILLSF